MPMGGPITDYCGSTTSTVLHMKPLSLHKAAKAPKLDNVAEAPKVRDKDVEAATNQNPRVAGAKVHLRA